MLDEHMEYTRLGSSGLKVSRIALGCMSFGKPNTGRDWVLDTDAAEPIFRQAVELGITLWDGDVSRLVGRPIRRPTDRAGPFSWTSTSATRK